MTTIIGPGSWVRCINRTAVSEMQLGSVYKVLSVHAMPNRCNGPPGHQCKQIAFVLAGIADPCCSTCFVPVRPGGPAFMELLLNAKAPKPPTTLLPRNSE